MENVKFDWGKLNPLQLGRYAEYLIGMEFVFYGFDVFKAEVDDKGIDLIIRKDSGTPESLPKYYDVQVKSVYASNYIFFPKSKFMPRDNLLAGIVVYFDNQPPRLFLIPSIAWLCPNSLLVNHDYIEKKSEPEWGLNISKKNLPLLEEFCFDKIVEKL